MMLQLFSIKDSIDEAYQNSSDTYLRALIYLSISRKDPLSRRYMRSIKKMSKYQKKVGNLSKRLSRKNLEKKKIDEIELERLEKNKRLKRYIRTQNYCLEKAKGKKQINDVQHISNEIVRGYKQGFGVVDRLKRMGNIHSSYGKLVYTLLLKLSSDSPLKKIKRIVKREKSFLNKMKASKPEIKKYSFQSSKKGAIYLELQLMLFFLEKLTEDYSVEEKNKLIEELINQISNEDTLKER